MVSTHDSEKSSTPASSEKAGLDVEINRVLSPPDDGSEAFRWSPEVEKSLVRKLDMFLLPNVFFLYLFSFLDRANIGNAEISGMHKDLKLHGYQYNIILTVFYSTYVSCEWPLSLLCKHVGPAWFLPIVCTSFGIISLCTSFVHSFGQMAVVRFLLGIFEAAMLPSIAYLLSRWYTRTELTFRLCFAIIPVPLSAGLGGLLASGILRLNSIGSIQSWRMIFFVEGLLTTVTGLILFFTIADRPEKARYLTAKEKETAVARLRAERLRATLIDKLDRKRVLRGVLNPVTLAAGWVLGWSAFTGTGLAFFLPKIIQTIYPEMTVVQQQLRTVPPYMLGSVAVLILPFIARKMDNRFYFIMAMNPITMVGYAVYLATENPHARYGATFLIAGSNYVLPCLCLTSICANVVTDTSRAAALGTAQLFAALGGLISNWAFLPFDKPNYHIGNGMNLASAGVGFIVSVCLYLWMKWDNQRRDRLNADDELQGLTEKEVEDLDWKNPRFRWKL